MKDVSGIFQLPFIAESEKVLRRMMFQSQPNDFPISAERFSNHSRTKWCLAERCRNILQPV